MAAATAAVAGCAGQGDIDRSQPDKVDKSIFFDAAGMPKTFYYRQTFVAVPPTTNWVFEGMQGGLQKLRFEIKEKQLVGYRSFDYVIGSQNDFTGGQNNTDTPLVTYAIKSHFDVKREYNPATGEETNVISENTTDRPWDQRQFMRVDWSKNLVDDKNLFEVPTGDFLDSTKIPSDWYVSETDIHNPDFVDRPIVTGSYIDFVSRETRTPDYYTCNGIWDAVFDDNGPWNCGQVEVKVRNSFMEVKPSSYEPLEYPDNYPLLDKDGKPIQLLVGSYPCTPEVIARSGGQYSGADCGAAHVGGFSKFGFFRTIRQTYDSKFGTTELGRKYYANRWNIWEETVQRDSTGKPVLDPATGAVQRLGYGQRKAKPIVYYTNLEFPDDPDLFNEAQEVTTDWSDALRRTVAGLLVTEVHPDEPAPASSVDVRVADQPAMVILKKNSCNLVDFKAFLDANPNIANLVEDATGQSASALDKAHLAHACSVAEAATENLKDGDVKKFQWQRNGDLRYSFFHWVDRPQAGGPLGYGPSSADPETGEIVSASLYNYGANLNTYSQFAADSVELLNGGVAVDDILSGKTIADVFKSTAQARQAREAKALTPEARATATALLQRAGTTGMSRLMPVPAGATSSNLDRLKGTSIERDMLTNDIAAVMFPTLTPSQVGAVTPGDTADSSPVTWLANKTKVSSLDRLRKLSMNGCVYMADFADDGVIGLALQLKAEGLTGDALFHRLRTLIFRGLADHEMGHTMGLRHNFAGSNDALNYADKYWDIRTNMPADQWDTNRLGEYQYSTVMDYGSRFNSDVHGLGKYDTAAIRFGYGGLIDLMPPTTTTNETGDQLAFDLFVNDYKKIPDMVGGVQNLTDGGVMRYSTAINLLQEAYTSPDYRGGVFLTPGGERPYKFCSDEFLGNLECKPWDFGANQQEIVNDTIDRYKNYYLFWAYKRGRVTWSLNNYLNRLLERYYARYTEAFQFFYFYGGLPYDLSDDLLRASIDSLNAIGEVLQTPEPGAHCTTSLSPSVMVVPAASGPNACTNGIPAMNIQIPDGKPYFINFSDDYYYRITRAGSLYEKLVGLISLTSTAARFFRVDTFADSNNFSINYYRVFKDEVLNTLRGVIRNEPSVYGGYVSDGQYLPTPIVDLDVWGKVNPAVPAYMQPGAIRVDTPVNKTIRFYALALALGNLNSTWDSTLDIASYMTVTVKGSNDDITFGATVPVHEYEHPQSGLVYRSPQFDQRVGIGVQLVDELNMLTGTAGVRGTIPTKYGSSGGQPLPNWQTAKADLEAARASGDQTAYNNALNIFQGIDFLLGYRVDLLDDLRRFKQAFAY